MKGWELYGPCVGIWASALCASCHHILQLFPYRQRYNTFLNLTAIDSALSHSSLMQSSRTYRLSLVVKLLRSCVIWIIVSKQFFHIILRRAYRYRRFFGWKIQAPGQ